MVDSSLHFGVLIVPRRGGPIRVLWKESRARARHKYYSVPLGAGGADPKWSEPSDRALAGNGR